MATSLSFRFADEELNEKLIQLLRKARIKYTVDQGGGVHYSRADEAIVENDLICAIRDQLFSSWQVLSCPSDWTARYRQYMACHDIPYYEEWIDNEVWFLIPAKYRPHLWKMTAKKQRQKVRVGP